MHTQGIWQIETYDHRKATVICMRDGERALIAEVYYGFARGDHLDNAHLIVAAPLLLAACRMAKAEIESMFHAQHSLASAPDNHAHAALVRAITVAEQQAPTSVFYRTPFEVVEVDIEREDYKQFMESTPDCWFSVTPLPDDKFRLAFKRGEVHPSIQSMSVGHDRLRHNSQ